MLLIILLATFYYCNEGYIMTLGDYRKQSPESCNENVPKNGICSACSLQCGQHKYKKNCDTCETRL